MTGGRSSRGSRGPRLGRAFFDRPTRAVARALLGARVVVRDGNGSREIRLVETEAYVADDSANHASAGPTWRNLAMFGPPGTLYVFRIHRVACANFVTRPGEAVLLRAAEPLGGPPVDLSGPGRFCRELGISIRDNGADATKGPRFSVYRGAVGTDRIVAGPRIGIRRAVDRPLRFVLVPARAASRPIPARGTDVTVASPSCSRADGVSHRTRTKRRRPSGGGTSGGRTGGR